MKWSEQMRVLLSEDEHYNQLMYDVNENILYLNNKKLIHDLESYKLADDLTVKALLYDDVEKIMKKYPFFTDIKFLLNCIIKEKINSEICYAKIDSVSYGEFRGGTWLIIFVQTCAIGIQISEKEDIHLPS